MNSVTNLFNQQYGNARWKSHEDMVKRYRCSNHGHFCQIFPSNDGISDTPIFACKFAQQPGFEHFIALANEDGNLAIHDTTDKTARYGTRAHNNAIFDLAWMFDNMKIVTAAGDHTVALFDVSNSDIQKVKTFHGHSRSVKTVSFRKDDPSVFATGGRDGNIIIWDTRTDVGSFVGKPDRTIFNSHNTKTTPSKSRKKCFCSSPSTSNCAKSVTGLVFQDENTLISCGAGDGVIKIWDLRKNYQLCKHEPVAKAKIPYSGTTTKNGFSNLLIDKNMLKLYANCLDNTIYTYNMSTYAEEPIMKYVGHQNSTFFIKSSLSRDGDFLISGSSDENAYIWSTKSSKPIVKLVGHSAEVTCVAWCENDDNTIVTCSDDMSHKIWRIESEECLDNWQVIGKGKAEIYPIDVQSKQKRPILAQLHNSGNKQRILHCEKCHTPTTSRVCNHCPSSAKRKRESQADCEDFGLNKRSHGEFGPRCLFEQEKTGSNLEVVDENAEETGENHSEHKLNELPVNLPNFVIDGVAPHINYSPPKRRRRDWLTLMRLEKQFRRDINTVAAGSSNSDSEGASSTDAPLVKAPKLSSTQNNILRFFKVKCDGHSGPNKCGNNKISNNLIVSSTQSGQK